MIIFKDTLGTKLAIPREHIIAIVENNDYSTFVKTVVRTFVVQGNFEETVKKCNESSTPTLKEKLHYLYETRQAYKGNNRIEK